MESAPGQELLLRKLSIKQGLCRSRKKSQNFVGFLETNLQQNWPILRKAHSAEIFWANLLESNRFCADFTNVFNETRRNFAHLILLRGEMMSISLCNNNRNTDDL